MWTAAGAAGAVLARSCERLRRCPGFRVRALRHRRSPAVVQARWHGIRPHVPPPGNRRVLRPERRGHRRPSARRLGWAVVCVVRLARVRTHSGGGGLAACCLSRCTRGIPSVQCELTAPIAGSLQPVRAQGGRFRLPVCRHLLVSFCRRGARALQCCAAAAHACHPIMHGAAAPGREATLC